LFAELIFGFIRHDLLPPLLLRGWPSSPAWTPSARTLAPFIL